MNTIHRFEGVFPPLTTPFSGEEIALKKLEENIRKYNRFDLTGYVILGSTGEAVHLSDEESLILLKTARKSAGPGKKIIVGTGRESTRLTIDFTNKIADLGADAALVRTPSYYKIRMTSEALRRHYLTLADHSRLPIVIYNFPQVTGLSIDADLVVELAGHANVAGIKDSTGDLVLLNAVAPRVKPSFSFLVGSAGILLPGLEGGASGGILALADAAPEPCASAYRLFSEGKRQEAFELQNDLFSLNKTLIQTLGIPGIKYAMDLRGYYGGPVRLPLLALGKAARQEAEACLRKAGLLS
jgi:4-hydroxy-2-oxoglutarate aldolase